MISKQIKLYPFVKNLKILLYPFHFGLGKTQNYKQLVLN